MKRYAGMSFGNSQCPRTRVPDIMTHLAFNSKGFSLKPLPILIKETIKFEIFVQPNDRMIEERFWSKVDKGGECWLWSASKNKDGYGQFRYEGTVQRAHRFSWLLSGQTIPEGNVLRHKCRNTHCVNPEHLETGTIAENNADRIRDGTSTRGTKSPTAKLTEDQVKQIRARATESRVELAKEFGVCHQLISNIILRKIWNWLTD